jgi:hypothetical protein
MSDYENTVKPIMSDDPSEEQEALALSVTPVIDTSVFLDNSLRDAFLVWTMKQDVQVRQACVGIITRSTDEHCNSGTTDGGEATALGVAGAIALSAGAMETAMSFIGASFEVADKFDQEPSSVALTLGKQLFLALITQDEELAEHTAESLRTVYLSNDNEALWSQFE